MFGFETTMAMLSLSFWIVLGLVASWIIQFIVGTVLGKLMVFLFLRRRAGKSRRRSVLLLFYRFLIYYSIFIYYICVVPASLVRVFLGGAVVSPSHAIVRVPTRLYGRRFPHNVQENGSGQIPLDRP
jgi:multisubunit Na+/H+ antiporter MnhE subunit